MKKIENVVLITVSALIGATFMLRELSSSEKVIADVDLKMFKYFVTDIKTSRSFYTRSLRVMSLPHMIGKLEKGGVVVKGKIAFVSPFIEKHIDTLKGLFEIKISKYYDCLEYDPETEINQFPITW